MSQLEKGETEVLLPKIVVCKNRSDNLMQIILFSYEAT